MKAGASGAQRNFEDQLVKCHPHAQILSVNCKENDYNNSYYVELLPASQEVVLTRLDRLQGVETHPKYLTSSPLSPPFFLLSLLFFSPSISPSFPLL